MKPIHFLTQTFTIAIHSIKALLVKALSINSLAIVALAITPLALIAQTPANVVEQSGAAILTPPISTGAMNTSEMKIVTADKTSDRTSTYKQSNYIALTHSQAARTIPTSRVLNILDSYGDPDQFERYIISKPKIHV